MAVQMLYQLELGQSPIDQILAAFDPEDFHAEAEEADGSPPAKPRGTTAEALRYAEKLVRGTRERGDEVDALIREHAENWRLERMPTIDRNILRLALYEMLYEDNVPNVVIVDEAIELAKRFGSENSSRFVNGLLDGVLKSRALERGAVEGS